MYGINKYWQRVKCNYATITRNAQKLYKVILIKGDGIIKYISLHLNVKIKKIK